MAEYRGSIELISGIKPKNNGRFPLVNAQDVQVDDTGKRLDARLSELANGGGGGGADGATFIPSVSTDGVISWTNDKGLPDPPPVNIKGGNGKDGVSATHSWNGTVLTVTSASGTSSSDLKGADGNDGINYVLTDADRTQIANIVATQLGGQPVYGIVGDKKIVTLHGNIAFDEYTFGYIENGEFVKIGKGVYEPDTPDYNNILTNGAYTVEMNKRWSASSKTYSSCDGMICLLVPTADVLNKTIYFKGFTKDLLASNQPPMWMNLDSNKNRINNMICNTETNGNMWDAKTLIDRGNGVYSIGINTEFAAGASAYIVMNMAVNASAAVSSLDGLIMTIDEPIE